MSSGLSGVILAVSGAAPPAGAPFEDRARLVAKLAVLVIAVVFVAVVAVALVALIVPGRLVDSGRNAPDPVEKSVGASAAAEAQQDAPEGLLPPPPADPRITPDEGSGPALKGGPNVEHNPSTWQLGPDRREDVR